MLDIEFKPCPFCGNEEIMIHYNGSKWGRFYQVKCETCGASTRGVCLPTRFIDKSDEWDNDAANQAITLWNTRNWKSSK